ncbi:hypothetical protein CRG98_008926 [Punica granatum]|uniref:Uncharacterized protein n=1 Tax=Punica granatum TaxID=22663 RepID=A0A2I0KQW3_PUNGR|nr:hypothetical protein CRG98_008926 [Punica granatum]
MKGGDGNGRRMGVRTIPIRNRNLAFIGNRANPKLEVLDPSSGFDSSFDVSKLTLHPHSPLKARSPYSAEVRSSLSTPFSILIRFVSLLPLNPKIVEAFANRRHRRGWSRLFHFDRIASGRPFDWGREEVLSSGSKEEDAAGGSGRGGGDRSIGWG